MMKALLIVLLVLVFGYAVMIMGSRPLFYYGHHFDFENELEIEIDSLEINVGGVKTTIIASNDSLQALEGNIDVPQMGYPHKVEFTIYGNNGPSVMNADSFNCYNCDGYHQYTLTKLGARYEFRP